MSKRALSRRSRAVESSALWGRKASGAGRRRGRAERRRRGRGSQELTLPVERRRHQQSCPAWEFSSCPNTPNTHISRRPALDPSSPGPPDPDFFSPCAPVSSRPPVSRTMRCATVAPRSPNFCAKPCQQTPASRPGHRSQKLAICAPVDSIRIDPIHSSSGPSVSTPALDAAHGGQGSQHIVQRTAERSRPERSRRPSRGTGTLARSTSVLIIDVSSVLPATKHLEFRNTFADLRCEMNHSPAIHLGPSPVSTHRRRLSPTSGS